MACYMIHVIFHGEKKFDSGWIGPARSLKFIGEENI